jgi:hypothetical protein
VLALPGACLHLYGKDDPRRGRKMGHVTFVAPTLEQAQRQLRGRLRHPGDRRDRVKTVVADQAAIDHAARALEAGGWWPFPPRPCTAWAPTPRTRPPWPPSTPPRAVRRTIR